MKAWLTRDIKREGGAYTLWFSKEKPVRYKTGFFAGFGPTWLVSCVAWHRAGGIRLKYLGGPTRIDVSLKVRRAS